MKIEEFSKFATPDEVAEFNAMSEIQTQVSAIKRAAKNALRCLEYSIAVKLEAVENQKMLVRRVQRRMYRSLNRRQLDMETE